MATASRRKKTDAAIARESMGGTRVARGARGFHGEIQGPPGKPDDPPKPTADGFHGEIPGARLKGLSMLPNVAEIPISRIFADPDQPRKHFDEEDLERLARSLKRRGQLAPIRVRYVEDLDEYVIVCGERRWRAAGIAGLTHLKCEVVEGEPADLDIRLDQLVENACRKNLRPIEQAKYFREIMEGQGWSGKELAEEIGISPASVSRSLSLLGLPDDVRELVDAGSIPAASAYHLAKLDDEAEVARIAGRIVDDGLSRDDVAAEVDRRFHGEIAVPSGDRRDRRDPTPDRFHGEIPGVSSGPKALPDWRDRPAMGLGLDADVSRRLADAGIESAGEAWGLLETGFLRDDLAWPYVDLKRLELALTRLREEAGDPDPFARPIVQTADPFAPRIGDPRPPGKARPAAVRTCRVCGCTDDDCRRCIAKTGRPCHWVEEDLCSACEAEEDEDVRRQIEEFDRAQGGDEPGSSLLPWRKQPLTDIDEVLVSELLGVEVVIRSGRGIRPESEINAALSKALVESGIRLGLGRARS